MNKTKLKGNLLLLLTAMIWGISFIAQSKGVETIPPATFNGVRCILGALVLLPVIFLRNKTGKSTPCDKKDLLTGGVICGAFLCVATMLQTIGMLYTSPGKSGFITALYMVIIPIVGIFLGKKTRPIVWISVCIATGGLYLMCMDASLSMNRGDFLTLLCAFVFTGHILAIDHFSPKVDGVKLAALQFFVCGVLCLIYTFAFEPPTLSPILNGWLSIGYSGIFSCGVAYTLQIIGQKYTDPTSASILMSLESVFAALSTTLLIALGWNLTGGALTIREISGCVLMFTAIILVQLPERNLT